jgi:hypothetical protein
MKRSAPDRVEAVIIENPTRGQPIFETWQIRQPPNDVNDMPIPGSFFPANTVVQGRGMSIFGPDNLLREIQAFVKDPRKTTARRMFYRGPEHANVNWGDLARSIIFGPLALLSGLVDLRLQRKMKRRGQALPPPNAMG